MKIFLLVCGVLVGLLSIAAGAAKVVLVPQEVEFLTQFDFANWGIVAFGSVQIAAGILSMIPAARLIGTALVAAGFLLSFVLIVLTGDYGFAVISMLPVVLAGLVAFNSRNREGMANLEPAD